ELREKYEPEAYARQGEGGRDRRRDDGDRDASTDWDDPVEFPGDAYGPPVPLEALPRALADHAASVAASQKVPLDLIVGGVLGASAGASAGRAEVTIGTTHTEPLNLWISPVATPGERKPAVIRETVFPLEEEEKRLC